MSRRLSFSGTAQMIAVPITTTPAIRNLAASTKRGGQSPMASLPMENAEAHSRQNAPTRTGKGNRRASEGAADQDREDGEERAAGAVLMVRFPFRDRDRLAPCYLEI